MSRPADPARQTLLEGLAALHLELAAERVEALLELAGGVAAWGRRINLSGHRTPQSIVRHLVLEALALLPIMPSFETLADLGSGAGFPGLPIAIARSEVRVTLIEARERRHHFQRAMRRELGLPNVELLHGRAEALEPRPHDAVVAQAAASPRLALRWMLPWAAPGGWTMLPAAAGSRRPELPEGLVWEADRPYSTPGGPERLLLVARRAG